MHARSQYTWLCVVCCVLCDTQVVTKSGSTPSAGSCSDHVVVPVGAEAAANAAVAVAPSAAAAAAPAPAAAAVEDAKGTAAAQAVPASQQQQQQAGLSASDVQEIILFYIPDGHTKSMNL